jgi:hypothetical protein
MDSKEVVPWPAIRGLQRYLRRTAAIYSTPLGTEGMARQRASWGPSRISARWRARAVCRLAGGPAEMGASRRSAAGIGLLLAS